MSALRTALVLAGMAAAIPASAVTIPWRVVGNPGKAPLRNGQGTVPRPT